MNSNKVFFFLLTIVQAVVLLVVLFVDHILVTKIGIDKDNFFIISSFLVVMGVALFWFFSYGVFETLFAGKKRLKNMVRKTLHELNTPVATIKINTKMLKKHISDEKQISKLNRIDQACNNLLMLYENMEYGIKKEVHFIEDSQVNLKELVDTSIEKFADIKNSIKIENEIPSNVIIKIDKKGFLTVIDNLLSNAIKYNKNEGFVKVFYKNSVLIIQDSGIGIDTKNLFVVFESYYQADVQSSGFGMGLALVKEFCDKNKIAINIDSKENEGTTFFLDLSKSNIQ